MAKSKSKRKAQAAPAIEAASKKAKINTVTPKTTQPTTGTTITPPPDTNQLSLDQPKTLQSLGLTSDDVEIAVDVLTTLTRHPSIIKTKACKDLRTAVYDFRNACTTGLNAAMDTNLTARISGALADGKFIEARVLLAEMKVRGQTPKLGALCRWVRDLDVVSGLAEQLDVAAGRKRSAKEEELLGVLDAVLRLTGPTDYSKVGADSAAGPIIPRKEWDLREGRERRKVYDSVLDKSIFACLRGDIKSQFQILETTPPLQRKPPNLHPAILWTSLPNAIPLSPTPPKSSHHTHPIVPNLHLLKDILSPLECDNIIAAAETIGFTPDAPVRAEGEETSVLAHNFYWIIDEAFQAGLWERVKAFVPENVGGRKVRGLNRRFRVYRYVPGAEYRAHIDGAWPPSSIDPATKSYIYDSSPPTAKQSSLFTFLIYLNDEFAAGETTFFLPSQREGSLNAYPIKPIQGSVAMFPHGETNGSLLHEGTGVGWGVLGGEKVGGGTAKYVIRTDVLYDVDPSAGSDDS